jgi:hypothetical protein
MAHFAKLNENNLVTQVIVVNNEVLENKEFPESEPVGIAFCKSLYGSNTRWVQTSYNGKFRRRFAGLEYIYDPVADHFIHQQPYPSWVLDDRAVWVSPVPMPKDGKQYDWDEPTVSWIEIAP